MRRIFPVGALLALVLPLGGCDKLKEAAATGEPQTSYCEALCEWAIGCIDAERGADATALDDCLAAARGVDPSCADAESGEIDPATSEGLTTCTDAIEANASSGDCSPFTGRYDEIESSTTPAECASQGTDAQEVFDTVQDSTEETNDELCDRFTGTFCGQTSTCFAELLGEDAYQAAVDILGEPQALCEDLPAVSSQNDECRSEDQYAPGESATDVNTSREAARECLQEFASLSCSEIYSGDLPAVCAPALEDPTAYAGALLELFEQYQDASSR